MPPNESQKNSQKAWHSVRRASQQLHVSIEDSMDLGAVCETPISAKTPIREAFENFGDKSSSSRQLNKKTSSSSSQSSNRKRQELIVEEKKQSDDDGEMEYNFSDLEVDEEKQQEEKEPEKQQEEFEKSQVFYSSDSDTPQKTNNKPSQKKGYQPTQEQASNESEKEEEEKQITKSKQSNLVDFSQYFTPSDEDEPEATKEGYSLRKTPTRAYQEKKKRKKMIKKKETLLISSEEEKDEGPSRNDKMYESDEIPDEDIDALEEQAKARKKKQPQTEEERREREKQEEERKKAELLLRKKKLTQLSNSMRKKNQHKSIYVEDDDNISKDLFSSGKRKSVFDEDELFSQPSSQEEQEGREVFSSPKKRLKKKSGSPVGSPIRFDKEDSEEEGANSEELENLAQEIRENNLLLSSKKKKKPLSLKTQKTRRYSSSSEEEPPRRRASKKRNDSEEDDGEVTMSQFIVSDEEDEAAEYNVYRMVDMMEDDLDSQEFHSILTSNTRLSSDFKSSFAIYIHFITSHLLDEEFIKSLKFKDRTHFANASKMVEGKLETVKDSLVYSSAWKSRHKNLLQFYPIIKAREISLKDTEIENTDKFCNACGRKNHNAEFVLIFKPPRATTRYEFSSGAHINWIDSPDENSEEENDLIQLSQRRAVPKSKKCKYTKEKSFVGSTCYKRSLLYHSFQHYKFHLIQHIIQKIDKIATTYQGEEEITSDYILEKIVSKKSWTESLYKKYLKLIEEAEACYTKSKDTGVIDVVDELFDVYDSEEEVVNNSDEEKDNGFIVTNTRGGLRLKRTKPQSPSSDEEQDDAELIEPTEEPPKEKPKPKEIYAISPTSEEDNEDKELDFLDKEDSPKPKPKPPKEISPPPPKDLDSSDDDILNYNF